MQAQETAELTLNKTGYSAAQFFDLTNHKLHFFVARWYYKLISLFVSQGQDVCLKFVCEFPISKYSDS